MLCWIYKKEKASTYRHSVQFRVAMCKNSHVQFSISNCQKAIHNYGEYLYSYRQFTGIRVSLMGLNVNCQSNRALRTCSFRRLVQLPPGKVPETGLWQCYATLSRRLLAVFLFTSHIKHTVRTWVGTCRMRTVNVKKKIEPMITSQRQWSRWWRYTCDWLCNCLYGHC